MGKPFQALRLTVLMHVCQPNPGEKREPLLQYSSEHTDVLSFEFTLLAQLFTDILYQETCQKSEVKLYVLFY